MKESCKECYFFRSVNRNSPFFHHDFESKSCVRYPPKAQMSHLTEEQLEGFSEIELAALDFPCIETYFPIVAPDWWCGEFAPADKVDILRSDSDEEELP